MEAAVAFGVLYQAVAFCIKLTTVSKVGVSIFCEIIVIIKVVFIDPPYNTGNDFVYKDNFTKDRETSEDELGLFDEETDNRTMSGDLFQNTESNGRFHSDWCSMMYPRLQIAKDLLSEDGVIFISIDDNEQENLKKICDEIFGERNFITQIVWEKVHTRKNSAINFVL